MKHCYTENEITGLLGHELKPGSTQSFIILLSSQLKRKLGIRILNTGLVNGLTPVVKVNMATGVGQRKRKSRREHPVEDYRSYNIQGPV